jgi:putative glutamine amidotransferase
MKILVTQRSYYHKEYNENRDTIDQKLVSWVSKLDCTPILVPNNLVKKKSFHLLSKFITVVKPAGLILSGGDDFGKFTNRDKTEIFLLKYFLKNKKPILGICRGMLLISKFFGSKIIKKKGHVNTTHAVVIRSDEKDFPKKINSYHNYSINKCPKNFVINITSEDCSIESISNKAKKIECCMWHPERDKLFNKNYILRIKNLFNDR